MPVTVICSGPCLPLLILCYKDNGSGRYRMLQDQRQAAADAAMPGWMNQVWPAVFVGCVYVLVARLSLGLLTPDGVAVFWPAAGISAGTLIVAGPSARWAVVVGTMAATIGANLMGDRNLPSAFVFALCNAGEAVLCAWLIQRYVGAPFALDRLSHVLALLGAAIVATVVSGVGGTLGFAAFHGASSLLTTWLNWFAADALGIITIAPFLIGLAAVLRDPPGRGETGEGLLALALVLIMSVVVVALPREVWATVVPIALLFPTLLWIGARCQPLFAAAAAFVISLAIVWMAVIGAGLFGAVGASMDDRVLAARAGILAVALCAYVLAALFAERRAQQAALAASEASLQEALTAGAVSTFVLDLASGVAQRSANAPAMLGFDPQEELSTQAFLARVHPDDRARVIALARGVTRAQPGYTAAFRFRQPNGREVWLEEIAKGEFDGLGRLVSLKGLTLDVTTRKAAEDQRHALLAALDRGLDNLLTRIPALARDTRDGKAVPDDYVTALDSRICSMLAACRLLSRNSWNGAGLAELVRDQLTPHGNDANTTVAGPPVTLTVPATQALAAVLHELVTNAVKHGALSTPHGRLEVGWSRSGAEGERVAIDWRELRGPPVPPSPPARYGLGLIRDLIPRELGGNVVLDFTSEGVRCRIELPLQGGAAVRAPV